MLDVTRPNMRQGQVVGFYGRSGIGKSVLCRIMAGLIAPGTGTVEVGLAQQPVTPGMVGFVQQRYPLFDHRTLHDNLLVAAQRKHAPADARQHVDAYLERFGLAPHRRKYPALLSGGQRQRAAIAQQLLCSDHLILLDEPFSGLDVAMIDEVKRIIVEVTTMDELNTVIIVSHDIVTTTALADRLWLLGYEHDAAGAARAGCHHQPPAPIQPGRNGPRLARKRRRPNPNSPSSSSTSRMRFGGVSESHAPPKAMANGWKGYKE